MQLIVQKVRKTENYHILNTLNFSSDVSDVIFLLSYIIQNSGMRVCFEPNVHTCGYIFRCGWVKPFVFGHYMGKLCMENYNTKFRFIILINLLYVWGWFPFIKQYFKLNKSQYVFMYVGQIECYKNVDSTVNIKI